jgi:glycosyltransferase involved in cell wall biosynthesis
MKILLVADGRSPITRGWVQILQKGGWETTLVSTFPCQPVKGVRELIVIPVALSSMAGSQAGEKIGLSGSGLRSIISKFRPLFMAGRYWIGPLSLNGSREKFLDVIKRTNPDVVHALRIPFEGMLARVTPSDIPFLVSIWGNDLTLHAKGSPLMARETRRVLQRADGLLADANRDLRLGREWGLRVEIPTLCVPGGGGIDLDAMQAVMSADKPLPVDLPPDAPVIINPRGFRPGSVRNDTFFKAILLVLNEIPEAIFVCAGMAGQPEALDWVQRFGIEKSIHLLPFLPQGDLWRLFKRAQVSVSISEHDGTPNSLLEAMALGCFPVVGEIESVREWIIDGANGFLVDPGHAPEAAEMIVRAISDKDLLKTAAKRNQEIIKEHADKNQLSQKIESYYEQFVKPE